MSLRRRLWNLTMIATGAAGLCHDMLGSSSRVRFGAFLQSALTTEFERAKQTHLREACNAGDDIVLRIA